MKELKERIAIAVLTIALASPAWSRDGQSTFTNQVPHVRGSERNGPIAVPKPIPQPQPSSYAAPRQRILQPQPSSLVAPNPLKASTESNRVLLSWANISGETGFLIERRRHDSNRFSEIAKTTANTISYTDIATATDVNYEYRVRAYDVDGGLIHSPYTNAAMSNFACE